jgi:capsular polysaccharide biosynthesis protein
MELREYYKILKSNISVVIYVTIIVVIATYAWFVRVSQTYSASLLLNISRIETQQSADYRYDQFYRFQADEKFAETIVEWLKSPGIAHDIFTKAGVSSDQKTMRQLGKSFSSEKLASNLAGVQFSTQTEDEARKIASAIDTIVSEKTQAINASAKDPDWFRVDSSNLIVLKNIQDLKVNLAIAALLGIFAGSLLAFGKHYISDSNEDRI